MVQPLDICRKMFFDSINVYLRRFGLDVLQFGYSAGIRTFLVFITVFISGINFGYTMYAYEGDLRYKSWACVAISVQGVIKISTIYLNGKEFYDRVHFIQAVYKANTRPSGVNYLVLEKWSARFRLLFKITQSMILVSCLAFVVFAVFEAVMTGQRAFITCIMIPGVDEETLGGYIVICIYHSVLTYIMYYGLVSYDVMKFLIILHVWPMVHIFEKMSDQLNQAMANRKLIYSRIFWMHLRNLIKMHQELMQ